MAERLDRSSGVGGAPVTRQEAAKRQAWHCSNSSSWDDGPDVMRCALPAGRKFPPPHDMHSNGGSGWGNPPARIRRWCWRCLRRRWFARLPVTNRYGWSWQYDDPHGHRMRHCG